MPETWKTNILVSEQEELASAKIRVRLALLAHLGIPVHGKAQAE